MVDTLTSSRDGGGGREKPPAPSSYEGDMPWERDVIAAAERAAHLSRTEHSLAHLALHRAVFSADEPLPIQIAPFGLERYDRIHSMN